MGLSWTPPPCVAIGGCSPAAPLDGPVPAVCHSPHRSPSAPSTRPRTCHPGSCAASSECPWRPCDLGRPLCLPGCCLSMTTVVIGQLRIGRVWVHACKDRVWRLIIPRKVLAAGCWGLHSFSHLPGPPGPWGLRPALDGGTDSLPALSASTFLPCPPLSPSPSGGEWCRAWRPAPWSPGSHSPRHHQAPDTPRVDALGFPPTLVPGCYPRRSGCDSRAAWEVGSNLQVSSLRPRSSSRTLRGHRMWCLSGINTHAL